MGGLCFNRGLGLGAGIGSVCLVCAVLDFLPSDLILCLVGCKTNCLVVLLWTDVIRSDFERCGKLFLLSLFCFFS